MTYPSLLLRLLLIVALSLNGYAAAAMSVGGGHAMFMGKPKAVASAQVADSAECHDGAGMAAMMHDGPVPMAMHHGAGGSDPQPAKPDPNSPDPNQHGDDCCGKFRCQCDCLQAVAIVRIELPAPPQLSNAPLALPREAAAPSGVLSLPIRPPIA
ncbi:CopL family metal-binding regulatory protein [Lysobacter gummosus]|jgi:hypothetical protein|uniref:CopL family metal-binding regulatory protein n=1 Tax=Lysobacter gummosus TaxID=262324 RepID=A0ABY3XJY2_9GAMM|nr:CopL family metal-binding regulatory protein [Lysobacter gummosus]ALN91583.1 hypothetical protein LG3211_2616 [Lysobacter gummosus]UNP31941.1 CopL family metal-binding regulatory protein [Lysobacter gummosus]